MEQAHNPTFFQNFVKKILESPFMQNQGLLYWRLFSLSFAAIKAYKARSFFVIAAISLGISSLTIIIASIEGASKKAEEMTEMFGPDAVMVFGGNIFSRAVGMRTRTLTFDDMYRIRDALPGAYIVTPMLREGNVRLKFEQNNYDVGSVDGSNFSYSSVWNWPLAEGRDISEEDVRNSARVALLGNQPALELFPNTPAVGQTILVNNTPVTVIGLLEYRGAGGGGGNIDDRIIMPYTTVMQRFNLDRNYMRVLRIKFNDISRMDEHIEDLKSLLRNQHKLTEGQDDDFSIISAKEIQQFLNMLKGGLTLFLGITALTAMIVGGFVLANLFYLSVSERTREIGIKKAIGAPSKAILLQFLMEAVTLTFCGAVGGLILGMLLGSLLEQLDLIQISLSGTVFLWAFIAALAVGIIFGLRPARQASKLDPIQALRGTE